MPLQNIFGGRVKGWILFGLLAASLNLNAQSNVTVRVMAANLNGNTQSYQPFALRILQGLKPDIVCIQEFNYSNNADSDFRFMVDTAFGTNFVYYREPFTQNGANSQRHHQPLSDSQRRLVGGQRSNRCQIAALRGRKSSCPEPIRFTSSACICSPARPPPGQPRPPRCKP